MRYKEYIHGLPCQTIVANLPVVPLRPKTHPTPALWSKDFVEHLRTVHFALIATAVTLVIVAITTKPYSTAVASRELRQIQDLRTRWSANFIRDNLRKDVNVNIPHPPDSDLLEISTDSKVLYLRIKNDRLIYVATLPNPVCDQSPFAEPWGTPPEALARLEAWWDGWKSSCYVYFPQTLYAPSMTSFGPHATSIETHMEFLSPKEFVRLSAIPRQSVNLWLLSNNKTQTLRYHAPLSVRESPAEGDRLEISLLVIDFHRSEVSMSSISSYLGIQQGTFHESFRDLQEVAKANRVESLTPLDGILSKVELSDSPVFEAFGIKFPADVATIGGTIVLLCVQLYFFIYLRKLSGTLKEEDEGWNVPWIGMDTSPVARASSWATIVLFPIVSLLVLGTASAIRLTRGYWGFPNGKFHLAPISGFHWTVDAKLIAMIVAIILSAYLGNVCWKYRPQLAADSAAPKPLEEDLEGPSGNAPQPKLDPNKIQEVDQS